MPKTLITVLAAATLMTATAQKKQSSGYPITQVPFTQVEVAQQSFWGQRLKASQDVTIPLALSKNEETGRYRNFTNAAIHIKDASKVFDINDATFSFDDTDPYKTIEGASYLLQTYPQAMYKGRRLDQYIDSIITVIASGQESDGYLYTSRTQNPEKPHRWSGRRRWERVEELSHELYNLGHMCEAAVAHYYATGKRSFLDVAIRYADCVCREIGADKIRVVPGHQIAEMGLAKLYLATGDTKYLKEAKYFLDARGRIDPSWTKQDKEHYTDLDGYIHRHSQYSQSHEPVTEQREAVGHAVRAGYMYAGMADVAALTGDTAYIHAIDRIWENIVGKKMYLTGGVGSTAHGEAFGSNYQLPNETAYCETCAAIAQVYMNYRLFLLHGDAKYYDTLERVLYNGVLSGISIDGGRFFYPNPLASSGQHERKPWFGCACCPSNAARFIPSLPQYIYATDGDSAVYINLYAANSATLTMGRQKVTLTQNTEYPWDGAITIRIDNVTGRTWQGEMRLRIPGWARNSVIPGNLYHYSDGLVPHYTATVNGEEVTSKEIVNGYLCLSRKWKRGDTIVLTLDMLPRVVVANDSVEEDRQHAAIERGPLVYCAEWADNAGFDIPSVLLNQHPAFNVSTKVIMNTTVTALTTQAQQLSYTSDGRLSTADCLLTLIPYYAWNHRGKGQMAVWFQKGLSAKPKFNIELQFSGR